MANHKKWPRGLIAPGGVVDRIIDAKLARKAELETRHSESESVREHRPTRPRGMTFKEALRRTDRINIIAEIKRRSPSRGVIRENFNPGEIALGYERGGAAAISVLCEEDFFDGSLDHLRVVASKVGLPLLRKDFVFELSQVDEAAAAGAHALLLITAMLELALLVELVEACRERGLDALVEVHDAVEMERAARAGAGIIGVNNRDLRTFDVDLETSVRLAPLAPPEAVLVAESGINTAEDINRLREAGFVAFLIGERFMRAEDPGAALSNLLRSF